MYAVDEEEKHHKKKKKKDKNKEANFDDDPTEQREAQQEMESFLDQLLSSDNKRMDEQRAVMSPFTTSTPPEPSPPTHHDPHQSLPATHHKISISPSESSHGSLEHTSPILSTQYTDNKGASFQSFSEEDSWVSVESVGSGGVAKDHQYVNGETGHTHYHPKVEVIKREEGRSRSRSEENVYTFGQRHSSLEDILRPTSEVSLIPHSHNYPSHHHQVSNSSDVSSSIDSSNMSTSGGGGAHHESIPSFGNQEIIKEMSQEDEGGCGHDSDESLPLNEFNSSIVSSVSDNTRDSRSLSFYSATLGLDFSSVPSARKISVPVGVGAASSSGGRRLSSPPMMVYEEDIVEM